MVQFQYSFNTLGGLGLIYPEGNTEEKEGADRPC